MGVYDANKCPLEESAVGNHYLWQGRWYSWETGLYYFRARWYDPITGRWLSKDPIGISGGLNQYVFCGDSPVDCRDPFGLFWKEVGQWIDRQLLNIAETGLYRSYLTFMQWTPGVGTAYNAVLMPKGSYASDYRTRVNWDLYRDDPCEARADYRRRLAGELGQFLFAYGGTTTIHEGVDGVLGLVNFSRENWNLLGFNAIDAAVDLNISGEKINQIQRGAREAERLAFPAR